MKPRVLQRIVLVVALSVCTAACGSDPSPLLLSAVPGACPDGASSCCALGTRQYEEDGACLPSDPCHDEPTCAAAHRVCENGDGAPRCGRCIDGFEEEAGGCVEAPITTFTTRYRVGRDDFWAWDGGRYTRVPIRGVNLSNTLPGTGPNGNTITYAQYTRWFDIMRGGGINTVRVYALHPPAFYSALVDHNEAHPEAPIYLMHGVWLPGDGEADLFAQTEEFESRIENYVDVVHGAADGYTADASVWTIAWLIGREVYAREVLRTDARSDAATTFEGDYVRMIDGCTPAACWVAARLDFLLKVEDEGYGATRPVAFSNWMELDPLEHPSEPDSTQKAVTSIDLRGLDPYRAPAGHFISFHVYPYYPRFVSADQTYRTYADELGPNAYRGLLVRLREAYLDQAILVAEYGVPSSWGRAYPSYSGMHHGGHSEADQATYLARMTRDIHETGYAGGLAFQWQDGWWKRTWITNPRTFPSSRYAVWHDLLNPQQSYGLIAFDPPRSEVSRLATSADGAVRAVDASIDAGSLYIDIALAEPLGDRRMTVGFDTYADDLGDTWLPRAPRATHRYEFALEIHEDEARLQVIPSYDLYRILEGSGTAPFASEATNEGDWEPVVWRMTTDHTSGDGLYRFVGEDYPLGTLRVRRDGVAATGFDPVALDGATVRLRIPFGLIQFADPSTLTVVHDDPDTEGIDGRESVGVRVAVALDGTLVETDRYRWATWDAPPETVERLKPAAEGLFGVLRELAEAE